MMMLFFPENAGELHFIILRRLIWGKRAPVQKSPHYNEMMMLRRHTINSDEGNQNLHSPCSYKYLSEKSKDEHNSSITQICIEKATSMIYYSEIEWQT
jgi:hypothetical protein